MQEKYMYMYLRFNVCMYIFIYIYIYIYIYVVWINLLEKDIRVRKALSWNALHSILYMRTLWKSSINLPLKRRLVVVTVESIPLYGCESWTLTLQQQQSLNCTYTQIIRRALNISRQEHMENKQLYGHLPPVSSKVMSRRMRMAVHCIRHPELSTNPLILWEPTHGSAGIVVVVA